MSTKPKPLATSALITGALLTIILGPTLTACGSSDPPAIQPMTGSTSTTQDSREEEMRISIGIGGQRFTATLKDSAASRDLIDQLPVTIAMSDHAGVEKTGRLPSPLSLDGQPDGADPDVGDLGYYAPGNDLVLYYGDQSYFDGIVVLGRMEDDAAERIRELEGDVSVRVEAGQ